MNATALEKKIEYIFRDKAFLKSALTHRSYLNENPAWGVPHNERLEFLGDAVLELVATEELFNRYPDYDEGKLTAIRSALVNYQFLARGGLVIGLEKSVLLSHGEARDAGRAREVILANAMESLIGAIYLDGGYTEGKKFINKWIMIGLHEIITNGAYRDPKSTLQEKTQAEHKTTPVYRVLEEVGPEHKKIFKVGVYFKDEFIASGEGYSKQDAEVDAAKKALEKM